MAAEAREILGWRLGAPDLGCAWVVEVGASGYRHRRPTISLTCIGLGMGASQSMCTIRPLVAAICFHQMFEGMGLGGCILQAEYDARMKAGLVFFFATTMSFGVVLGLALTGVYRDNSPTALVVVGLHNAASARLLHYMALIELLAADFLGPKLHGSVRLQLVCLAAVLLGVGAMPRPSAIVLQASAACFPDPPPEHHFQPDPAKSGR
ncbi:fe(2+) transport protein 1-like [Hordeum vulgare subsp. vulgare]|uniref:fe(2+) transport protein 1-like n=1 Tax=Hordeum vulgare subsp. vulgare TaxID=112509 RepID=UPI001D1A4C1A|nr:fe(2+) transport protein 1-like [Hordeum vulgare subsp. vulgare]